MRHSSKDRERQLRFSIRKFTAGVASVAIASLYFLSASPVSADSHTITVDSVELSSLTAQERQQVTFALPPMIDPNHDACYILVYQPKGSGTNVVAVSPATGSGRTTGGSAKSQLMKALPSTGSKELDVAFYGLGAGMLGLAGYMLWKNKKSGKYLLVAVIAAGGVASSTDVLAAMRFLAPTQNIVIESDNGLYTLTPQEIEGYEYVGYMTKDCELIPADTTDATKYVPVGQGQTVEQGGTLDPVKSISNLVDLPKGTTVAFKTPVDTNTSGDKDAIVVVKYPDGSSEEVTVNVTITPKAPTTPTPTQKEADRYTPTGQSQVVELGQPVEASGSISNLVDLPKGAVVAFETPVDTSTSGIKNAVVIVTYPDGSFDKVPVTIGVTETIKISHSETHNPHGHNQTVTVGSAVDATKSISDFSSLIAGTTATFAVPVDTTTPGVKDAVVVVTYPDGSTDIVSVQVTVNAIPRTEDQTVHVGEAPAPERSVPNLDQLPPGTSVAFKEPVDTTTIGDKEAIIVVTYPDGTTEERPVVVTVIVDPTPVPVIPNVDTFNPFGQPQTVTQGGTVEATGSIANFDDLIPGTTATFVTSVDTTTPGDKPATVLVSYPDGSSETVDVVVTVLEATKPAPLPDTSAPKLNEPAKTPVADKTNLTDDEKAKVAEEVKKANPELPADAEITVGNDGAVTVKVPGKDEATLTPAQTVVDKPDTSAPKLNEPAKTPVADKTNLTDDEKAKVAEEVKKANPELPADAEITVGNDGAVTVKVPNRDAATLTPAQTVVDKPDTSAPTLNEPVKTPVADKTKLTDDEKAKVAEEVKKANPELPADAEITVGNDGAVTVKVPNRDAATLTPAQTVVDKPDTSAPTLNEPAKTPVADKTKLTDDEKAKVAEEVKKANPELPADAEITVGNDGAVTVKVPDRDAATLTPAQTVVDKPDTSAPKLNEPAKTPVADKTNLTDDEKTKVAEEVKKANPELPADAEITVGNDGAVTVKVPGKDEATLTPAQTVVDKPDTSAPKLNEPAKTPVADKTNLTDDEKTKVAEEVKKANPELPADAEITVGNDGAVTVKVPNRDAATLTPAQTVVDKPDTSAPTLNEPAKTPVADKTNLTDDEKAKVADEVKKANPELPADAEITVGNDGAVTVKVPGKDEATLTPAQTVVDKPDTSAPTLKEPAKTPVADKTKLTDDEKAKVADEVKKANPELPADAEITVGNDGAVTVKVPGKDEATLTPAQTVVDKPDTSAPTLKEPAKTPVADKTNLTDDEKAKVEEEVKKANPELPADAEITVGNDGAVTVKVPGKDEATLTPAQTVVDKPDTSAPKLNEPAKTPVADKTNLTDDEKAKVAEEVKKANPELPADAEITVGNDGAVTVKVPGKDEATLTPAQTVVDKPDTSAPKLNEPAKTPVADKTNLTDDEKAKVAEEVKKANPELPAGTEVTVGNDGKVTITYPDKTTDELTPEVTVEQKPKDTDRITPNNPVKTPVADLTKLTDDEKTKVADEVKKANPDFPAGTEVTVGNDGKVTITYPDKTTDELTPEVTVEQKPKDTDRITPNNPVKTPVADKTNLTDDEKAKVAEEVKKANPELPAGTEVTVGNDGKVTITYPDKTTDELTPEVTVEQKPKDTDRITPNNPVKTPVADLTKLTDDEKTKVADEVKKANPDFPAGTEVTVGNDGKVTITYPDKTTDELTPEVTVEQKPKDTDRITPNNPVKTPVADLTKLTDDEKTKVADEVKKANPDFPAGTEVTVGNDGKVTITYPDKTTDELTPEVTVEQKPKDTDRITPNNPVKTPVADLTKLTDDEKAKVADEVKKANPDFPAGTEVTVGNDGKVTITYPDKTTDELTPEVTVEQKPKDTDRITPNNPAKTPVADKTNLTDDEKAKVEEEVKKANPELPAGTEVTVGNDGKVTITYPDKTTDELTPEVTVEQKPKDTDRITPNNPVKTPVADLTKLTDDEKTKVADEVKKANPDFPADTEVTVGNDGKVTITYPDKTTDELTPEVTVEQKPKDTDRITPNNPVKTPVADLTKLTDDEKTKVADEVKKANPDFPAGTEVTVGNDGKVTITYPDKTTDELTPEVTVEQKPKDTDRITPNNPVKTPVADLTNLTDDEKTKVADEVKKANPDFPAGTEVTVGNDGKVTITYPDKTTDELTPEVTVEQKPKDTDRITPNNPVKTPVADLTNLTDDEKTKVADEVKKANPDFPAGTEVTVGNDGKVTITYPDKTTDELTPEVTVEQKPKDTDRITPNNPVKTPVADLTKLTDDEKTKVADEVKKANPDFPAGTEVTVGNDGKVTITYPDKTTDELTPEVTVEQKPKDTDRITPNNPVKTPVADLTKLTDDEKAKVADEVKKANPDFPAGTEVTVGNDGKVTITYPDKTTDELTPEVTVEEQEQLLVNAPALTPVADKSNLTSDEKAAVQAAIKAANPTLNLTDEQIVVNNDGSTTITVPGKKPASLTQAQTVIEKSAAPTVNPIDSDDTAITGTGIPGATVSVTVPGSNEPKTATVTPEGTWSIPVETPLPVGTKVSATQTEPNKAVSPQSNEVTVTQAAPTFNPEKPVEVGEISLKFSAVVDITGRDTPRNENGVDITGKRMTRTETEVQWDGSRGPSISLLGGQKGEGAFDADIPLGSLSHNNVQSATSATALSEIHLLGDFDISVSGNQLKQENQNLGRIYFVETFEGDDYFVFEPLVKEYTINNETYYVYVSQFAGGNLVNKQQIKDVVEAMAPTTRGKIALPDELETLVADSNRLAASYVASSPERQSNTFQISVKVSKTKP